MLKSKKILALIMTVAMVISMMSCFAVVTSAATVYSNLPDGYMVVNAAWAEADMVDGEMFDYTLGGKTYKLEYNVTAYPTIEDVLEVPEEMLGGAERTIVLAPGEYSTQLDVTTDVNICGPYFGQSPNNNPHAEEYDYQTEDWALYNGRSVDPTKEAVFTADIEIGDGCNNITIDGIAFTGAGRIIDTARTDALIEVTYTLKNLYFTASTSNCVLVYTTSHTKLNKNLYIDSCRFADIDVQYPVRYKCETFEFSNSYMGNICAGTTTNVQFYMYANSIANVIDDDTTLTNSFVNNRFENTGGANFINFAATSTYNPADLVNRTAVVLNVVNNDFFNVAVNGRTIQDQTSGQNQRLTVTGNRFVMKNPLSGVSNIALGAYSPSSDQSSDLQHAYLNISKNYFEGYATHIAGASYLPYYTVGANYFAAAPVITYSTVNANATVYDTTLKYASTDFELLNSNIGSIAYDASEQGTNRTATLYAVSSGIPSFTFKGDEVTCKTYSDANLTKEITETYTPVEGDKLYVKAQEGSYMCIYEITVSTQKGSQVGLYQYGDATICDNNKLHRVVITLDAEDEGVCTFPVDDEVSVSTGATYAVYTNADCTGSAISRMALKESPSTAYLKITAANGTTVDVYTLMIYGSLYTGISAAGSAECSLVKLAVEGGTVTKTDDGYTVKVADYAESVKTTVLVSDKATYNFYMDPECQYAAASTDVVNLQSLNNKFYIRIVAENGVTMSDPIPVTIVSARKSATYKDSVDVPLYATSAVDYLNNNGYGIFGGDQNGNLNPRKNITRYELAKVMVVLTGINIDMAESVKLNLVFDDFYDIQGKAAWALPYVRAAYAAGLINGVSDGKGNLFFNGASYTTREQFTTVFVRAMAAASGTTVDAMYDAVAAQADAAYNGKYGDASSISNYALKAVKLATYNKYVEGDGKNFNPKNNVIRADVAKIIYNSIA